jgi:hypothetical protein
MARKAPVIRTEEELRLVIAARDGERGSRPGLSRSFPNAYDANVHERLVQAISIGGSGRVAALYAGISYRSFLNWLERGERDVAESHDTVLARLAVDIERAKGQAGMRYLARIEKASETDWRAAKWKLETVFPEDYKQGAQIVINNENNNEAGVIIAADNEYEAALRSITTVVTEIRAKNPADGRGIVVDSFVADGDTDSEDEGL